MWLDKEGTCFASSLMRERYPPSPVLRDSYFMGSCSGKLSVKQPSVNMPEGDEWSITTNSRLFTAPGFRSRSRRGTRLSTVSLASASPAGTAMAQIYLGHEEDINPRRLGRRDTRGSTGVPDHFSSP